MAVTTVKGDFKENRANRHDRNVNLLFADGRKVVFNILQKHKGGIYSAPVISTTPKNYRVFSSSDNEMLCIALAKCYKICTEMSAYTGRKAKGKA